MLWHISGASFLWGSFIHALMHCGQAAINPYTPIGQWLSSRSREVFVLGLLLVPSRLMTDLPPCMSRQMGDPAYYFRLASNPLFALNWLNGIGWITVSYLWISQRGFFICSELTRIHCMRWPLWDDPMTSERVWHKWSRFLNLKQFGVK